MLNVQKKMASLLRQQKQRNSCSLACTVDAPALLRAHSCFSSSRERERIADRERETFCAAEVCSIKSPSKYKKSLFSLFARSILFVFSLSRLSRLLFFLFFQRNRLLWPQIFRSFLSLNGRHEQRERVHERRALVVEVSKETTARTGIIITRLLFVFVVLFLLFLFVLLRLIG